MQPSQQLTNLQQELLKIYSYDIKENDLKEIKRILLRYFAKKASDEADKVWEEKGLTNEDMDRWLNEDS
jgi:hypothetical protein